MLTPVESFWLRWHKDHSPEPVARRARMILLAASGSPPTATAMALAVSEVTVTRALKRFERQRLDDFPRPALSLEELLTAAQVDVAHARQVMDLAVQLFDATHSLHRLPKPTRQILSAAALLHNVALEIDEPRHHTAGRELLLGMNLKGYTPRQQRLIAYAVGFHRKKVNPEKAEGFKTLTPVQRRQTLILSALLRVADGLDSSQSQSTQLQRVVITPRILYLHLSGPEAKSDAARARKKADLWCALFKTDLDTLLLTPTPDLQTLATLPLDSQMPMSQFARQIMARYCLRWQAKETAALSGDPVSIKTVRGAIRRLRTALDLFGPYLAQKPVRRLYRRLHETERLLGPVWDLEVILAEVKSYAAERRGGPLPFQAMWEKEQRRALATARHWLSGPDVADLQTVLAEFIAAPSVVQNDEPLTTGAQKVFTVLLDEVAERQAAVTPDQSQTYHPLRITLRKCRYALQFFRPVLKPQVKTVIADLVRAQDHLGAFCDAQLLQQRLADFLKAEAKRPAKAKELRPAEIQRILNYSQTRREYEQRHLEAFRQAWPPVRANRLQRRVGHLLLPLNPNPTPPPI